MINEERNKVSVKIYESTRDSLEKAKMQLPARERPDYADMIEPAVARWLGAPTPKPQPVSTVVPKGVNARWHAMLDEILDDKDERIGIEKNLQWAVDSIRKKGGAKRKPA